MKRYSLLSSRPDWRYQLALISKDESEVEDEVVKRYIRAKIQGFKTDPILQTVTSFSIEDRGLVEALYLGGAEISDISSATKTDPKVVKLLLDLYFDVEGVRDAPLLRNQIATKELNSTSRSYKVYASKYGWRAFVRQFFSVEEVEKAGKPSVSSSRESLLLQLESKINEIGLYPTGSDESKALQNWAKIMLDLTREMRLHEIDEGPSEKGDIMAIMRSMAQNRQLAMKISDLPFIPRAGVIEEDGSDDES